MVLSEFSRQRKNYSDLPVQMSAYLSAAHYLRVFFGIRNNQFSDIIFTHWQ